MIEAKFKNLQDRFNADMDWISVQEAFVLRDNYKTANIPAAIDTYIIQNAQSADEKKLAKMAKAHYKSEIEKLLIKKNKYQDDCLDFETKIKKGSKAKDLDLKLEKRQKSVLNVEKQIERFMNIENEGSARIFPNYYAPALVRGTKGLQLRLMRYQLMPGNGQELPSYKYNLFNARRDRLLNSKIWKPVFGQQHAIFPFKRFYENVDDGHGGNKIIYFESHSHDLMWAAAIYEESKIKEGYMRSMAAITDEPPPEVLEAGHDRCPVFLTEDLFEKWLNPSSLKPQELLAMLDHITPTYYDHYAVAT